MSLASALEIGKSGLKIYQVASEVVSENIANVNTPGYSRQRVILEDAPPSTANGFPLGTGVRISSVERYYDALLQKQLVNAETTSGYDTAKSTVLQQIEPVFNEIAQDGLGAAISDFFNSWQDLSLNPTGNAERQAVLDKGQILSDQFNYVSRTLNNAIVAQNDALPSMKDDVNQILSNIAKLNGQIKVTEQVEGNANEMRDQRDYLVRQLAENMAISTVENSDGTTDITYSDATAGSPYALVTGSNAATLSIITTGGFLADGITPRNDLQITPAGGGATTTIAPTTGKLGATVVTRDTTLPAYLTQVNTLAVNLATQVNTQNRAGFDLNGVAVTIDFFSPSTGAGTIAVNPAMTTTFIGASGAVGVKGDNANALLLAGLNSANGYSTSYNTLMAQVGLDVQTANTVVTQDSAFMKQLTTLRDSNSGVSLDEELTDLMKYQRSYQASAKLITTAGEMMDTIIAMMR